MKTGSSDAHGIGPKALPRAAVGLALASAVAVSVAACGSSSSKPQSTASGSHAATSFYTSGTPGGTPVRGGIATVLFPEAIKTLDPVALIGTDEIAIDEEIFNRLFEYVPGGDKPQPALATSYTESKNGLTYTFHIRPNVKFSNGEPLTAEDVAYSLLRQRLPISGLGQSVDAYWKTVIATGPLTVKLELKKPQQATIGNLALTATSIIPKAVIQKEGEKAFALHPIGTGPFTFTSATPGYATVTLARNPAYWRAGRPYLDGLVFKTVSETNARILAVRSGSATVATGISFSQIPSLEKTSGVKMVVRPLQNAMPAFINSGVKPLNDNKVRLALNYATPREAIIKAVFKGMGEPSNDVVGHLQYWDASVPPFPYNLTKAKALLKESSAPNGFNTTIGVEAGEPDSALVASILQSTWAKIGVHVKIQTIESGAFFTNLFASKFEIDVLTDESFVTEQYPPDLSLIVNFDYPDSGNHADGTDYDSPRAIALIRQAATALSETERAKLFTKVQRLLTLEEPPVISIAELPSRTLVSDELRNFNVLSTNAMRFEEMWLQK